MFKVSWRLARFTYFQYSTYAKRRDSFVGAGSGGTTIEGEHVKNHKILSQL